MPPRLSPGKLDRNHSKKLVVLIFLLLAGLVSCAREAVPIEKKPAAVRKEPAAPAEFEGQLARLINEERGRRRLNSLAFSPLLARVAENHSRDMARNRFFSHTNPEGWGTEERINRAGYHWRAYGENIGCGQDSPEKIMKAWMKSSGHRENILSPSYSEIGIGFVTGGECRYYWTGLFGRPLR